MNICYRANADFVRRDASGDKRFCFVGDRQAPGIRASFGPIVREEYEGDVEPVIERGGPLRPVSWRPVCHSHMPRGWRKARTSPIIRRHGFVDLREAGETFDRHWSLHARRHERLWMRQQGEWQVVEPSIEEFIVGMRSTNKDFLFKAMFVDSLRRMARSHGDLLHLRAARRGEGPLEVGLATLDVPECGLSIHHMAFTLESARSSSAGVGLIVEWFKRALRENLQVLHLGVFWAPGSPKDWKGFSRFKAQFGAQMVDLPHPFVRWSGNISENFRRE